MNNDIYAVRLDADGNFIWQGGEVEVTNSGSSKSDMMVGKGQGCLFIAWTENGIVYAHRLREDGILGASDSSMQGDVNGDGLLNVLDVVSMVNIILLEDCPTEADMNSDTFCNVLDILQLVNIILAS